MNELAIISLVTGIAFLIFAIIVKPTDNKPKHQNK